ncbi:MAG: Crp/Fnr family transcriptional regulator [Bacteroidota bacterium]
MDGKIGIQEIIRDYYNVSKNSMEAIIKYVEFQTLSSGTSFIKSGVQNEYDYFLLSGICRSYVVNQKGEDITISFFQNRTVLTPNVARTFKNQSTMTFEALTDIEIGRFKAIELVKLMREISEMRSFANAVLQQELILKSKKELYNASLTAKERLKIFRQQFDSLENLIPHPIIASYLGITNISLSRLRAELAKE